MSLISLGTGAPLRLRIHAGLRPSAKEEAEDKRPLKPKRLPKTVPLFPEAGTVSTAEVRSERLARQVVQLILMNRVNVEILERFNRLGLHDWWLTAGALFQTVWNLRSGRAPWQGISDYDVFYFSEDQTWDAEDQVIQDCARLFEDIDADIQVRNQGRVHLWYEGKYGVAYPPLANASEGIMRFPARCAALGLKRTGDDYLDLFVPFGLDDVWNLIMTPNRTLPLSHVYANKAERWQKEWPQLTVHPWADDEK
ncbi:MAG: nucleotidyltransferase family protein [Rhodospirillaceae bacterium]|nr:nucleotidyltransferase family protein [Rhodospirillaceae bacterium]